MAKASTAKVPMVAAATPTNGRLPAISDGEKFTPSTTVDGQKVLVKFSIKKSESDRTRYLCETEFDWSGCSPEEVLEAASYWARIRLQAQMRAAGADMTSAARWATVDVKARLIDQERAPRDPASAARSALAKMGFTEAQIVEILAGRAAPK